MKILAVVLLGLIGSTGASAQKKTFVTVPAGNNIMDVLPAAEVFYYPQFTGARVFLRDGTQATAKLNYNRLVDEMHFIGPRGDTLALANEKTIKYVAVGTDTFYYDAGYIRLLSAGTVAKLAVRQIWVVSDTRQLGAFNSADNTVSVTSFKSLNEGGRLYDLTVNEDVVLAKAEHYYFGDAYNRFVLANKKNLLLLFPKEQRRLERYLRENKINFSDKEDLQKIMRFLEGL